MEPDKKASDPNSNPDDKLPDIPSKTQVNGSINIPPKYDDPRNDKENSGKPKERSNYIDKWKEPLAIATIILVVVTAFLAYYTAALFKEAAKGSEVARDAVAEAKKANDRASDKDVKDSIQAAKKDSIDSIIRRNNEIKDSRNYELSKKSLDAQINSIKETQRQFAATNQPFLEVTELIISRLEIGKPIEITYDIRNVTEIPALIVGYTSANTVRIKQPDLKEMRSKLKVDESFKFGNMIVTKETPYITKTELEDFGTNQSYWMDKQGASIYFATEVRYINLITNKYRRYLFYVQLKRVNGNTIFAHNTYVRLLETNNYDE